MTYGETGMDVKLSSTTESSQEKAQQNDLEWYSNKVKSLESVRETASEAILDKINNGEYVNALAPGQKFSLSLTCVDPLMSGILFEILTNKVLFAGCRVDTLFLSDVNEQKQKLKQRIQDALYLDEQGK